MTPAAMAPAIVKPKPKGVNTRLANAVTAALLFVALPLLTEHAMPKLIQPHQYLNLDVGVALAVAALSLNILLGYAGQISLGHAGLLAMGGFMAGIVTSRWHGPMALGYVLAMVAAAAVALIIGIPALRLRGLYLAIVTVVFGLVMQYSVLRSHVFSGGSAGVAVPRRVIGSHEFTDNAVYLVISLLLLLGVWFVDVNITRSRLGRAFRSIKEDELVAQSFGINTTRYKLLAFVVSGALAGLAGAMWGFAIGFVNNESPFNFSLSLQLVILVIVGGMGRRLPVLIAALVFWIFPSWISGLHSWAYVIGAVLLMYTVSRHPEGIGQLLADARMPGAGLRKGLSAASRADHGEADDGTEDMPRLPEFPTVTVPTPAFGAAPDGPLLEVRDVIVRFGGLRAVDEASFQVAPGKIIGLIGPNGAGKSTLFNAISGMTEIERGRILYRGREIQGLRADQRARLGIARTFQQVGLAKELTLHQNFLLAQHQVAPYGDVEGLLMLPRAVRAEREFSARADAAIESLGFEHLAKLPVGKLSGGQQRIVEIASLLITGPELVMLDEPSAGMAPAAAENLAERLKQLRDSTGQTVLIIEHNVPLVLDTCDYVYVLDAGRIISEGRPDEVAADERVIEAYFGAVVPV